MEGKRFSRAFLTPRQPIWRACWVETTLRASRVALELRVRRIRGLWWKATPPRNLVTTAIGFRAAESGVPQRSRQLVPFAAQAARLPHRTMGGLMIQSCAGPALVWRWISIEGRPWKRAEAAEKLENRVFAA